MTVPDLFVSNSLDVDTDNADNKNPPAGFPARGKLPGIQSALIGTSLSAFMASGFFGSERLSTPLLKLASILSASTPLGRLNTRSKEP